MSKAGVWTGAEKILHLTRHLSTAFQDVSNNRDGEALSLMGKYDLLGASSW